MSILYFAWLALAGLPSLVLSVLIIGLPLLAIFLKVQTFLALFEGQLIQTLWGARMPRRPASSVLQLQSLHSPVQFIRASLTAPQGWKTCAYVALHLLLSSVYFCLTCLLFVVSIALLLSPVVDPIVHFFVPTAKIDLNWYWFPVTAIAGVIGITVSLHISRVLTKLHSAIARVLLIEK